MLPRVGVSRVGRDELGEEGEKEREVVVLNQWGQMKWAVEICTLKGKI